MGFFTGQQPVHAEFRAGKTELSARGYSIGIWQKIK
jgi:hypothetical protein